MSRATGDPDAKELELKPDDDNDEFEMLVSSFTPCNCVDVVMICALSGEVGVVGSEEGAVASLSGSGSMTKS